ncbi:hypothetical protein SAMN04488057_11684 [Cyclobacterium lianum]|uniref:Uncharacterized protein n=1 Tax=Cyclobacterium lianum TaxID=388280 RepID=A0A1M7QCV8_9BACT|nr:hypothetical protein SAMN04488057_11684 [Cyclobacterium lianum]
MMFGNNKIEEGNNGKKIPVKQALKLDSSVSLFIGLVLNFAEEIRGLQLDSARLDISFLGFALLKFSNQIYKCYQTID